MSGEFKNISFTNTPGAVTYKFVEIDKNGNQIDRADLPSGSIAVGETSNFNLSSYKANNDGNKVCIVYSNPSWSNGSVISCGDDNKGVADKAASVATIALLGQQQKSGGVTNNGMMIGLIVFIIAIAIYAIYLYTRKKK